MNLKSTMAALIIVALPAAALAQSPSRIDQRQAEQQRRIDEGMRSGQLTEKEAARLQKGQQRIQKMEDEARADGRITREERRRIERAQDRESGRIRRERHDNQYAKKHDSKRAKKHDGEHDRKAYASRIDQRQAGQQRRIDEGVKSGQLTTKEAERLQKGQQRVQKMEDGARADGRITREERRRIERTQDRESERIRRESHDRQTARR